MTPKKRLAPPLWLSGSWELPYTVGLGLAYRAGNRKRDSQAIRSGAHGQVPLLAASRISRPVEETRSSRLMKRFTGTKLADPYSASNSGASRA